MKFLFFVFNICILFSLLFNKTVIAQEKPFKSKINFSFINFDPTVNREIKTISEKKEVNSFFSDIELFGMVTQVIYNDAFGYGFNLGLMKSIDLKNISGDLMLGFLLTHDWLNKTEVTIKNYGFELFFGYEIYLPCYFRIIPSMHFGELYEMSHQFNKKNNNFKNVLAPSLLVDYMIKKSIRIGVETKYNVIFDKKNKRSLGISLYLSYEL